MMDNYILDIIELELDTCYSHLSHLSYLYKLEIAGENVADQIYFSKGQLNAFKFIMNEIIKHRGD